MTRVIKRYANRKLYDTKAKKYLKLDDVARFIRRGEEIQVIDNETKQDATSVVLSSIILHSAKRDESVLPDTMLVDLIQQRGEAVMDAVKKSVTAGVEAAGLVQQEVEKRFKEAIEKGREQADSAAAIVESVGFMLEEFMTQVRQTAAEAVEENLTRLLASMNVPTRQEIERLEASVDELGRQIERLMKKARAKSRKKNASATVKKKRAPAKTRKLKKARTTSGRARKK